MILNSNQKNTYIKIMIYVKLSQLYSFTYSFFSRCIFTFVPTLLHYNYNSYLILITKIITKYIIRLSSQY